MIRSYLPALLFSCQLRISALDPRMSNANALPIYPRDEHGAIVPMTDAETNWFFGIDTSAPRTAAGTLGDYTYGDMDDLFGDIAPKTRRAEMPRFSKFRR